MISGPPFLKMLADQLTSFALLLLNRAGGINNRQPKLINHAIILVKNFTLEDLKAVFGIVRPTHVQACFVILQAWPRRNDSLNGNVKRRPEKERKRGFYCEGINLSDPITTTSACHIPGKGSVNIAIRQNDGAGFQWRNNVSLSSVRKVGRMKQGKRCRSEQMAFLGTFCRILHEWRRVPFGEENRVPFGLQPLVK